MCFLENVQYVLPGVETYFVEGRREEVPCLYYTCQTLEALHTKMAMVSEKDDDEIPATMSLVKKFLESSRTLIYCDGPWGVS